MNKTIKNIYYRGVLSSCNYACSYCPFAKRKSSQTELNKDKECLEKFCKTIKQDANLHPVGIFITPYGEALIHDYYILEISELSKNKNINYISCQTNLSFDIDNFLKIMKENSGELSKIKLWATFHPEMIDQKIFAEKVRRLSKFIDVSVGIVAIPEKTEEVISFRKELPKTIYLWINGEVKQKRRFSENEIRELKNIDPLFESEITRYKVEKDCCSAGIESIFVEANGDFYPCNINKNKLGNIYENSKKWNDFICNKKLCNCFLAYSNRKDVFHQNYFGKQKYIRNFEKIKPKAIFLDIDGTITDKNGYISNEVVETIKFLSENTKIYLATSLPYEFAMKKCKSIKNYISGGVFGNGGLILDNFLKFTKIFKIDDLVIKKCKNIEKSRIYYWEEKPYKIMIPTNLHEDKYLNNTNTKYVSERLITTYYSKKAGKLNSILELCRINNYEENKVIVMGNSSNDYEMIKYFTHSIAEINTKNSQLKKTAKYIMNINQLPMLIKS